MAEPEQIVDAQVRKQVRELLSATPGVREQTLNSLSQHAAEAASALIDLIRKKAGHPQVLIPLSDALVGLGKPAVEVITEALKTPSKLEKDDDLNVVNSLVDALYKLDDKRAAPALTDVLKKLPAEKEAAGWPVDPELTRVRIHETLAEWGDRGGLKDLMKLLGDGRGRVRMGVVGSLRQIGDRTSLVPLLRLHALELPVSSSGEQEIKEAFREIVRREGLAKEDPAFAKLTEAERATLERLFPSKLKATNGNGTHTKPTERVATK